MHAELSLDKLHSLTDNHRIEDLGYAELEALFYRELGESSFLPDGICRLDPRDDERVLFNAARAGRPHDNRPAEKVSGKEEQPCVVCLGQTTRAVDVAELGKGFTFINKNLFPVVFPPTGVETHSQESAENITLRETRASGMHFLQWTSSIHDHDWHNMPIDDCVTVMARLAALEKVLLVDGDGLKKGRYISIFKNVGHLVGGSLVHGHQQIVSSNVMPRRFEENLAFSTKHKETFSDFLLRENPANLLIKDYGEAVLLVPYYMRRPFDMLLLMRDSRARYLHQLSPNALHAATAGWRDAQRLIRVVMPMLGKELAYNVITHNGPGAGLYFEFLSYTQETGGLEHLGLSICQGNPQAAAAQLRKFL